MFRRFPKLRAPEFLKFFYHVFESTKAFRFSSFQAEKKSNRFWEKKKEFRTKAPRLFLPKSFRQDVFLHFLQKKFFISLSWQKKSWLDVGRRQHCRIKIENWPICTRHSFTRSLGFTEVRNSGQDDYLRRGWIRSLCSAVALVTSVLLLGGMSLTYSWLGKLNWIVEL